VATLLHDGRILVTGGFADGDEFLADAELYDPARGRWDGALPMARPRLGHTATVLADGRVLVAGGERAVGILALVVPGVPAGAYARGRAAELFDPRLGVWTPTGAMAVHRSAPSATLLSDGRVLLAGGYDPEHNTQVATAELYDPAANSWRFTGSMGSARASQTAILMDDGGALVAGGVRDGAGALTSAEEYIPATGGWVTEPSMSCARSVQSAMRLPDGRILVVGGCGTGSGAEVFQP
jgi:hypothetical protein